MSTHSLRSVDCDYEREQQLFRMQVEFCQTLADPARMVRRSLLHGAPCAVKDLVAATGQRQAKIGHTLALLC